MIRLLQILTVIAVAAVSAAALPSRTPQQVFLSLVPVVVEGPLVAIRCGIEHGEEPGCTARAIEDGAPVSIRSDDGRLVLLLEDSRVLGAPCPEPRPNERRLVRITGQYISSSDAMLVFDVRRYCGGVWLSRHRRGGSQYEHDQV